MARQVLRIDEYVRRLNKPDVALLAGYPRSGAALVRTIMAHCFDRPTMSIYNEDQIGDEYAALLKHIGCREPERTKAALERGGVLVKTHELPQMPVETARSLIIVRDGRRTLDSLLAFYGQQNGVAHTMTDLILGLHEWGDWSAWVRAWAMHSRRDSLWLRYEDVMADRKTAVDRIAAWFGIEPVGYDIPEFTQLQAAHNAVFRKAATTGRGVMTDDDEALFWECHGATMAMLGYHRDG